VSAYLATVDFHGDVLVIVTLASTLDMAFKPAFEVIGL
jgi:hypothetical protein